MSGREYRLRAEALLASADTASRYGQILEVETMANEWRQLAHLADLQDVLVAALEACGIETPAEAERKSSFAGPGACGLDDGSEQPADAGGEAHRQGAP